MSNYLPHPGDQSIDFNELKISKAQEVANALVKLDYFDLLEIRRSSEKGSEIIIFETEVEVGQKTKNDIQPLERIAVIFYQTDKILPEVLALREDFPLVPHLNLRDTDKPRSLCLFEQKPEELNLRWTPVFFLKRIREWLSRTARAELHGEDQPLEPLLIVNTINLILPVDIFQNTTSLLIIRKVERDEEIALLADWKENEQPIGPKELEFTPIIINGKPQPHGLIHRLPANIKELHDFLRAASVDLITILRSKLQELLNDGKEPIKKILNHRAVLIINLPKTRDTDVIEEIDVWAFWTLSSIKEIGLEIGIWEKTNDEKTRDTIGALIPCDNSKEGLGIDIQILNPVLKLSRENAAKLNGLEHGSQSNFLLVGCGALGSQVFMNLIRTGVGKWTLVDNDLLMPHNLARHALYGIQTGFPKAQSLEYMANSTIDGEQIARSIVTDILNPYRFTEELQSAYKDAQVIIDASASIPVARHLANDIDSPARRISIFLNPSGEDAVILVEDSLRELTLDFLEMQYYRHLLRNTELYGHLKQREGRIRYARSCGDISSTIPQDLVALHGAICSRKLRNALSEESASIALWRVNIENMDVVHYDLPTSKVKREIFGEWTLCYDEMLEKKIHESRSERLPNETGGVLIGAFDMERKKVYVMDTILSPPDSREWPTVYIRGCKGLEQQISEIHRKTAGILGYVGEWHSHPDGHSARPSKDDIRAFSWLVDVMDVEGLPALMMIAAKKNIAFFLGRMV